MEFLLLGGLILVMSLLRNVEAFRETDKALTGLKLPIGIVVILVGLSSFKTARLIFPAIMGLVSGFFLILDLLKMIPKTEEAAQKTAETLAGFQVPVGIITIIAAIIGMFLRTA